MPELRLDRRVPLAHIQVTFGKKKENVWSDAALHLYASVEQSALTRKWRGFRQPVIKLALQVKKAL